MEKNFFIKIMNKKISNAIKLILPPLVLNFILNFRKNVRKDKFLKDPKKQKLDLYYDEEMSNILETWGERNAWIEVQHIFNDKKGKILDIACGTGKVIEILNKNKNLEIFGCDISSFLIEKAKSKKISLNHLIVCDATDLPYERNFFDYSYSIGSLEHFTKEGIIKFLKSSTNVTKNHGYHMIPVSRSGENHGWIENYQSYYNNSIDWWSNICESLSLKYHFIDSSWEDEISVGKWLIVKKND